MARSNVSRKQTLRDEQSSGNLAPPLIQPNAALNKAKSSRKKLEIRADKVVATSIFNNLISKYMIKELNAYKDLLENRLEKLVEAISKGQSVTLDFENLGPLDLPGEVKDGLALLLAEAIVQRHVAGLPADDFVPGTSTPSSITPPRPRWADRKGDDEARSPPAFIAKHYAAEISAATLTQAVVRREDRKLYDAYHNWRRTNRDVPLGFDFPKAYQPRDARYAERYGEEGADLLHQQREVERRRSKLERKLVKRET